MNLNTPNLIPLLLKPTAPVVKLKRDKKNLGNKGLCWKPFTNKLISKEKVILNGCFQNL